MGDGLRVFRALRPKVNPARGGRWSLCRAGRNAGIATGL